MSDPLSHPSPGSFRVWQPSGQSEEHGNTIISDHGNPVNTPECAAVEWAEDNHQSEDGESMDLLVRDSDGAVHEVNVHVDYEPTFWPSKATRRA